MHHRVLDPAAAGVGRPLDNGVIIRSRFQFWSLDDLHVPSCLGSHTLLGNTLDRESQNADPNRDRKRQKWSAHITGQREFFDSLQREPPSHVSSGFSACTRHSASMDEPEEKTQLRATPRKGVGVRVGCGKAVAKCFQESDELGFFRGRQTELTYRHVLRLWNLGCRLTVHLLLRSRGAMSRFHIEREYIARVIEVDDFLQTLQVSIVHVCFRKGLAIRTLGSHVHVSSGGHLHKAVESRCQRCPVRVRRRPRKISQKEPYSQVGEAETGWIGSKSETVRRALEVKRIGRILGQAKIR